MINKISELNGVKEYVFNGDDLIVLTNKGISYKKNFIEGSFRTIRIWKGYLLYQNFDWSNLVIHDIEKNCLVKEFSGAVEYALWFLNLNSQIPIDEHIYILTENLNLNQLTLNEFPKCCNEKYGINRFKNSVRCFDVFNGNLNWQFELEKEVKLRINFTIIENIVIVSTSTLDLIGIDIETGKELWRLKNINANSFQIQPKTNYLISLDSNALGGNWYYVINPLTGEILVDKKFLDFYYSAGGSVACITDTHYYFMSNYFGYITERRTETKAHLGCINLATHELEWVEEIGKTKDRYNGYKKPEYRDGKFYLPRSEDGTGVDTLFIYEQ